MPDLEEDVRSAIAHLLQVSRADAPRPWVDQAVSTILFAAGQAVIADGLAHPPARVAPAADGSEARDIRHGDLLDELLANAGAERDL